MQYDGNVTRRIAKLRQQLYARITQIKVAAKKEAANKRETQKLQDEKAHDMKALNGTDSRTL